MCARRHAYCFISTGSQILTKNKISQCSGSEAIRRVGLCILALTSFCLLPVSQQMAAQDKYLVSTYDGLLSVYDLATNSLIEATQGSLAGGTPLPGPNNRLGFEVSNAYISMIDLTINRETNRLLKDDFAVLSFPVRPAVTPDGKFLLLALYGPCSGVNWSSCLYIFDTSSLKVVHKVNLSSVFQSYADFVVALPNKAYLFPSNPSSTQKAAVVDLTTFSVSSIALPSGNFPGPNLAAVTPDGSYVAALETESSDRKSHVLLISTATDTVAADFAQTAQYNSHALTISPPGTDSSKVFAYFSYGISVALIDLRANSPTYGMVLPDSAVTLDVLDVSAHGLAVNSDGSRLIVAGYSFPPSPNVDIIDTDKMLNDPQNAIIARVTVDNGIGANAVCAGAFSTIPPNTAPMVTGVSGDITNDMPRQVQITGGNFKTGALVRIGSMNPLPADVMDSSTLSVTVPANAPAGKALDIIVTNPQVNDPPDQRYQSGLLAGQFSILPNPKYQPTNQIASVSLDSSLSIYSISQQTMIRVPQPWDSFATTFNIDGKELYVSGEDYYGEPTVVPVDLKSNQASSPIEICPPQYNGFCDSADAAVASRDPSSGAPVVDVIWTDVLNYYLHVSVIDSNPDSPTFNTVIKIFNVTNDYSYIETEAVSPSGKYYYLWDDGALDIIDLTNGQFTTVSSDVLGVNFYQYQIGLSPDGRFMLLAGSQGTQPAIQVLSLSNPTQPKPLYAIVANPIPGYGVPYLTNYQVAGDRLYATSSFYLSPPVVEFNFKGDSRDLGGFRELGYYLNPTNQFLAGFVVSPDGAYLYLTDFVNDQVLVWDTSKLTLGKDPLLTAIRAPYYPYTIDVSPVAPD